MAYTESGLVDFQAFKKKIFAEQSTLTGYFAGIA